MKNKFNYSALLFAVVLTMSSCYNYTFMVGDGPQTGALVSGKNHYFIGGLAKGQQTDYKDLAGNATDYQVTIKHTFVDGLLNVITFGIYTPTTTEVQK